MVKIKCPSGEQKSVEECISCEKCLPLPIKKTLLKGRDKEKAKHLKQTFGVGQLVSECLRQSFYRITKEQVIELGKLWTFSRGSAFHDFFDFEKKEQFLKKEFPDFDIIGFIDAIDSNIIYELKTSKEIPLAPQTHHILQAQAYYSLLPIETQKEIKNIFVVYLSMDRIKEFEVAKRDITALLQAKAEKLAKALNSKVPPEKETSWLCRYCEFADDCENDR